MEGVKIVAARDYILLPEFTRGRFRIFNLCRSYRYQSYGYYVSLLAEARRHTVLPGIKTIEDVRTEFMSRLISADLEEQLQKAFSGIGMSAFELNIYFGRTSEEKFNRIASLIFGFFPVPLLQVRFVLRKKWELDSVDYLSLKEIPESHTEEVIRLAAEYFKKSVFRRTERKTGKYDLAILVNSDETEPPSDEKAIDRFIRAAEKTGFSVDLISRQDFSRVPQFDALFIREATAVNHHTYRFSLRAQAEGLVVIDDPASIIRCTNKVFLAELLNYNRIPAPKTEILTKDALPAFAERAEFPIILKKPDSYFSLGVAKVETTDELLEKGRELLDKSDLILAQEFLPTDFDWRIGILDRKPLFACRYYMAKKHWQIMNWEAKGHQRYGKVDTLEMAEVPAPVVEAALGAANLIGDGLYGVDVKEIEGRAYVIEVNDNPSIEADVEDRVLKDALYDEIMASFLRRVEKRVKG